MIKTKISAVSYINSYPFVYGLQHQDISKQISLSLDNPAKCAEKLIKNEVDIGLVPVVILNELDYYEILTDYCIGAVNNVQTVVLLSNCSLNNINSIYLDNQSRSSNLLCKILAKFYWNRDINYLINHKDTIPSMKKDEACIVIGDRVFQNNNKFKFRYDLSKEWFMFTGLPFVFAVWASNKRLNPDFKLQFKKAIEFGMRNIDKAIDTLGKDHEKDILKDYYTKNISYIFDKEKKEGMKLFLQLIKKINN